MGSECNCGAMKPFGDVTLLREKTATELRRFFRAVSVGIVSLVVYSSLYTALAEATRMPAVPTSIVAYIAAMVVSFVGHKYFTFGATGNVRSQIIKFVALHCICLLATASITDVVVDKLGWPYGVGILLVDIAVPLLSFLALKFVVFEGKSDAQTEGPAAPGGTGYR
jgi:putative flippase GtrA